MSIFNSANNDKSFNGPQPHLNSSDRTAYLKSKTKYAAAVNLAKHGGVLTKTNGARYVGTVQTTRTGLTSASSYSDYMDVAKGKYLLTPPPSSNLDMSFQPSSADVYYGNFTVTNYDNANVFLTMLGYPLKTQGYPEQAYYPNILVQESDSTPSAPTPSMFNQYNIVVDPQFQLFYDYKTCGARNYFQNVTIDPTLDLTFTLTLDEVYSQRPEIEQQAQRIIKAEAQRLRGFQFPARIHFDLDNCDSKASITPVAPNAPVISLDSITPTGPFTVTVSWLQDFDGGSPITAYHVYVDGALVATLDPQPCRNTHTLTDVGSGSSIWVTASNCVPKEVWNRTTEPSCTTLTSVPSNALVMPVFATVTWSSGMTVPNEVAQAVHLIIPSGVTLAVASGVTMTIRGSVTNNGTFTNAGVIHVYGSVTNNGAFTNTGGGTVINYSSNSVSNNGTLTNQSGGVVENKAGGVIRNNAGGTFTNQGTFANHGTFANQSTFNGAISVNAPVLVPAPSPITPLAWQAKGFIEGAAAGDKSGHSVSASHNGTIVAVGAPGANSGKGVVRIYQVTNNNNGTQWTLMGSPIEGVRENEVSGSSVSLSSDGAIVAIGAPGANLRKGVTRIYAHSSTQWAPMGSPIDGAHDGGESGHSVSLSSDGLTVAIGAPSEVVNGVPNHGVTRIYKWTNNSAWTLTAKIDGYQDEYTGYSVSLSSDGSRVAIGAPGASSGKGVTRVYHQDTPNWTLVGGAPIPGVVAKGYSGWSVSLSSNGLAVAVGAPYANSLKGETRVFNWAQTQNRWNLLLKPIVGLATGEQNGSSVSLQSDPNTQTHTVAICAPGASYVKDKSLIYRWNESAQTWVAMTKQLYSGERVGSACLSSDGKTAVFGASGLNSDRGITRMYAAT